jgi:hypothetical protein
MKCLSGAFVFNTLLCFLQIPNHQCLCVVDKRKAPRGIGISKLEGPVTYSTRSEFKVIGSSQLKFDSDIT